LSDGLASFGGLDLNDTRRAAAGLWRDGVRDAPDGWAVSEVDPGVLLPLFGLAVRDGLRLVGLTYRWDRDGEGRVVALPDAQAGELVERGLPAELAEMDEPDLQRLGDTLALGDALEGDGSPLSHLMASLAVRELEAFGQRGHGRGWLDELVVESEDGGRPLLPPGGAMPDPPPWPAWEAEPDAEGPWDPVVAVDDESVAVRFHTVLGRGGWALVRYVDRFSRPGSYAFESATAVVAEGGSGFVP
jgi:hypothetical protein